MVANGKRNSRLNPNRYPGNGNAVAIEQSWRRFFFIKHNIRIKCIKMCAPHQIMSMYCGHAAQKKELLSMELLIARSDVVTVVTMHRLSHMFQHRIFNGYG